MARHYTYSTRVPTQSTDWSALLLKLAISALVLAALWWLFSGQGAEWFQSADRWVRRTF